MADDTVPGACAARTDEPFGSARQLERLGALRVGAEAAQELGDRHASGLFLSVWRQRHALRGPALSVLIQRNYMRGVRRAALSATGIVWVLQSRFDIAIIGQAILIYGMSGAAEIQTLLSELRDT